MIHLLHHANCADGFAAACIAHAALSAKNTGEEIRLQPVNYDDRYQTPPFGSMSPGDQIYYLDYTPPVETIADLHDLYMGQLKITIIDHHGSRTQTHVDETARQTPRFSSIFDLTHSGAALTWKHFLPKLSLPRAIELIEWRDLGGAFQDPHHLNSTPALNLHAGLMRALPSTVEAWLPCLEGGPSYISLHAIGERLRYGDADIISAAVDPCHWLDIGGHRIPAITGLSAELVSDACTELLRRYSRASFAAFWFVNPTTGRITYGLRSRAPGHPDGHTNVADIAARLDPPSEGRTGGGGHPCAAGFSSSDPIPFA
ncbi:MAG: hypothetical protein J0L73_28365 [Verrucomicrobia bacterium]|nr:hypothetical protein [Verrucomicrobiota bacterium]